MTDSNNMEQDLGGREIQRTDVKPIRRNSKLKFAARRSTEFVARRPSIEGLEHLAEIPEGQAVVWGSSHLSDVDWAAIVDVVAGYRNIKVASLVTNRGDPFQGIPMKLIEPAGEQIFLDINNRFNKETNLPEMRFNVDNFIKIKQEMDGGNDIVIPAYDRTIYAKLPDGEAGIGGVLAAQLAAHDNQQPIVMPIVFDIHSDQEIGRAVDMFGPAPKRFVTGKRPESTVRIGSPIFFEQIPKEDLGLFLKVASSKSRAQLREEMKFDDAKDTYDRVKEKLKLQGQEVFNAVANLLPPEKRGNRGSGNDGSFHSDHVEK